MSTRARREREQKQRRQSILDAAKEVFWNNGYAATTIPQIAAAAELAPGTIYLYFPSKDALYAELLSEGYERLHHQLTDSLLPSENPRRQAERMIGAFIKFAAENPEYFDIIFFVLQREGSSSRDGQLDPGQIQRLKILEKRCQAVAGQVLRLAGLGESETAQATIDATWSMLAGVIFYFRKDALFNAVAAQATRLLLAAIFPKR